jgi:hypothetical protein
MIGVFPYPVLAQTSNCSLSLQADHFDGALEPFLREGESYVFR